MSQLPTVTRILGVDEDTANDAIRLVLGVGGTQGFELSVTRAASQKMIGALAVA